MRSQIVLLAFSLGLAMLGQAAPTVPPGSGPAIAARDDFDYWQFGAVNPGGDPHTQTSGGEATPAADNGPSPTGVAGNTPPVSNAANSGTEDGGDSSTGDGPKQDDTVVDEKPDKGSGDDDDDDDDDVDHASHRHYRPGGSYDDWKHKGHKGSED